jgi:hypothetical protein
MTYSSSCSNLRVCQISGPGDCFDALVVESDI